MNFKNNMSKVNWEDADWTKQDVVISRDLGCSREAVRQARIRFDIEPSVNYRKKTYPTTESKLLKINTKKFTIAELSKMIGCHEHPLMAVLRKIGKSCKKSPRKGVHDWSKFPELWYLSTDKELAVLIGIENPALVTQWRIRHGFRRYETIHSTVKTVSAVENSADMVTSNEGGSL